MATRDDNSVTVAMGVDTNGAAAPVKIDNATGYVLVKMTLVASSVPTTTKAKRDDNFVPSRLALTSANAVTPILIDNRNDYLSVTNL